VFFNCHPLKFLPRSSPLLESVSHTREDLVATRHPPLPGSVRDTRYTLPPFGHASQIGFLLVEPFEWRNVAQSPRRCAVLEPSSEMGSLAPEILGKAAVVQYGAHAL
jgi:hypothetical protein